MFVLIAFCSIIFHTTMFACSSSPYTFFQPITYRVHHFPVIFDFTESLEDMLERVIMREVGPLIMREVGPLKKSLDIVLADMLDPWEGIHSETDSVVDTNETINLEPVSDFFKMKKKGQCMVLGACSHTQITCAHIWPRYTKGRGLEAYELTRMDVNNPRNFLRLHKSIERAFDHKRLTFVPVTMSSDGELLMEVVLLDPTLFDEDISYNQITVKFRTLHHKHFDYIFTPTKYPFTRLLSAHTIRAFSRGKGIGWPEALNHEAEARSSAVEQARRSLGEESYAMKCMFNV
jgi:hypothetical protein